MVAPFSRWTDELIRLRDHLAEKLPSESDARRYAESCGMLLRLVRFSSQPQECWHAVIKSSLPIGQNKFQQLIEALLKDYPGDDVIRAFAVSEPLVSGGTPIPIQSVNWLGTKDSTLEKIIGKTSTLLPVRFLQEGLKASNSVARISVTTKTESWLGSGFLISDNLFITNHHVLPTHAIALQGTIQFNYQEDSCKMVGPVAEFFVSKNPKDFATSAADDWTAVKLEGDPQSRWGCLKLVKLTHAKRDPANIIQHPEGRPKEVALHHNFVVYADDRRVQYLTDTEPGSSGSPVFSNDWEVIAVHHSGGHITEPHGHRVFYRNEGIASACILSGLAQAGMV